MGLESFLLLLILGGITIVGYFLKDLPNLYRELRVEEFKGKNEKDLQKEAYFRQIKGTDIDAVLVYWTALMVNMDEKMNNLNTSQGQKEFTDMQQKVIMYGSTDTVKILSLMMQHTYKGSSIEKQVKVKFGKQDETKDALHNYKLMLYISYLISSLKKDFTGYRIEPIEILRIKINDIDSHKNKSIFEQAGREVEKEIKDYKVNF